MEARNNRMKSQTIPIFFKNRGIKTGGEEENKPISFFNNSNDLKTNNPHYIGQIFRNQKYICYKNAYFKKVFSIKILFEI